MTLAGRYSTRTWLAEPLMVGMLVLAPPYEWFADHLKLYALFLVALYFAFRPTDRTISMIPSTDPPNQPILYSNTPEHDMT